ncbi:hypothetical protein QJS04_geneDACA022401 [Acorus gramineus]|uniref:Maternal effect embryo arrest 22 n=1 Tax=Acorus gramineus TaxID=55184 RepID=A0AAV9BVT0_ACOGR|nr:hypothetical protein QJS04_geneDACA022401 [Acorus gramineus]
MAADVVSDVSQTKCCCDALKKKCAELNKGRGYLRDAIRLLEEQVKVKDDEIAVLKKAYEEQLARAKLEKESRQYDFNRKSEMEKEISDLKAEITSMKSSVVSGGEAEVNRLKNLLEKEKNRAEAERRKAEEEKKEVVKALELVKLQQNKVEEKSWTESDRREIEAEVKGLKELLEKEKKRGDSNRKKAELEKKKKASEALKLVEIEKIKAVEEKKLLDTERRGAEECRVLLEKMKAEASESREHMAIEKLKVENAERKFKTERQRADREKKRADLEMTKAGEQRRLAEAAKKKELDEKSRAGDLSQQLEVERQRRKELEKEIQKISPGKMDKDRSCEFKKCQPNGDVNINSDDTKVLKKLLKLEKRKGKHARSLAKLEKAQKCLLKKEILLIKQDFLNLSNRLSMLDCCWSMDVEGIDGMKIGSLSKVGALSARNNPCIVEAFDLKHQSENGLLKSHNASLDALDFSGAARALIQPSFALPGGTCAKATSGISFESESLVGGSTRNKSQNSAKCSTSASFSDRQLVDSQGRGSFSVTTSTTLVEDNSNKKPDFIHSLRKMDVLAQSENIGLAPDIVDKGPVDGNLGTPFRNSTLFDKNEVADKLLARSRKRKRVQSVPDTGVQLQLKDHDLRSEIERKLHERNCLLDCNDGATNIVSEECDKVYGKKCGSRGSRKVANEQIYASLPHSRINDTQRGDGWEIEDCQAAPIHSGTWPPVKQMIGNTYVSDAAGFDRITHDASFEDLVNGHYMKLLEFNNEADEEKYRMAMEMPLSPTLPIIDSPSHQIFEDKSHYMIEGSFGNEMQLDRIKPLNAFDVIDLEIDSNKSKLEVSNTIDNPLMPESKCVIQSPHCFCDGVDEQHERYDNPSPLPVDVTPLATDSMHGVGSDVQNAHHTPCILQLKALGSQPEVIQHCLVGSKGTYFVPDNSVLRETSIPGFSGDLSFQCPTSPRGTRPKESLVAPQMTVLSLPQNQIQIGENEFDCPIVSQFTRVCPHDEDKKLDAFHSLEGSISEICSGLVKGMKCSFIKVCWLDVLLSLIEDFLVEKEVVFYNYMSSLTVDSVDSDHRASISDGLDVCFSSKVAKFEHLVAGSNILASICLAINRTACGQNFLSLSNLSYVRASIKSIVFLLEKGDESCFSLCHLHSTNERAYSFPPCEQCPFAEDTVCIDELVSMLLGELQGYTVSGIQPVRPRRMIATPVSTESSSIRDVSSVLLMLVGQLGRIGIDSGGERAGLSELESCLLSYLDIENRGKNRYAIEFAAFSALVGLLPLKFQEIVESNLESSVDYSSHANIVKNWFSHLSREQQ